MKRYRIREGSPADVLLTILGIMGFVLLMSIPSTIEGLL